MKQLSFYLLTLLLITSCQSANDNNTVQDDCDYKLIVSEEEYQNAPSDYLNIDTVVIEDNCLHITFGASGCSGDTWNLKLISDGSIMESYPIQTRLRLSLENEEMCDAFFTKTISFDIEDLRVDSYSKIYLNIDSYAHQGILYEY